VRSEHELAFQEVRKVVARNHGFDYRDDNAFEGWDTIKQSEMVGAIFDAMSVFLGSVGVVTLALGAIGVINIMLVSVTERTREIGLRKALGATHRSILLQFFLEGIFLTVVSGMIGMGLSAGVMAALGTIQGPGGFDPPKLVLRTAILAIQLPDSGGSCCRDLSRSKGRDAATRGSAETGIKMTHDILREAWNAMRHNRRRTPR